jgi:GT2 family glycosyltransferase
VLAAIPAEAGDEFASRIAVVVVNWNAGDLLCRCLESLTEQTLPAWKVIVVDNASTDSSLLDAERRFHEVEIIRATSNLGFAAANNLAIRSIQGARWVALLNPDAFPEPDWLEQLMRAATEYSNYSFFACRILSAQDPAIIDAAGDAYHISGLVWKIGHRRSAMDLYTEPAEVFSPCAAAALYRRDALEQVGGFDEDFFCYVEDIDLGFRLRLAGHRCLYVPKAVAQHVGSASSGVDSDFTLFHGQRNMVWTFVKNMPGALFFIYMPLHIALNVIWIMKSLRRGRSRIVMRAKWSALAGLGKMWRKRRFVQSARKISANDLRGLLTGGLIPRPK